MQQDGSHGQCEKRVSGEDESVLRLGESSGQDFRLSVDIATGVLLRVLKIVDDQPAEI